MLTPALVVLSMLLGLYLKHHLNTHESVSLKGRAFEAKGAEATRTCWEIAPKLFCKCGWGAMLCHHIATTNAMSLYSSVP